MFPKKDKLNFNYKIMYFVNSNLQYSSFYISLIFVIILFENVALLLTND